MSDDHAIRFQRFQAGRQHLRRGAGLDLELLKPRRDVLRAGVRSYAPVTPAFLKRIVLSLFVV